MICGISGLAMLFVPLFWFVAIVPAILGVVLSAIGFDRIKRNVGGGWGMAATGMVTGLIAGVIYIVMWVLWQEAIRSALDTLQ